MLKLAVPALALTLLAACVPAPSPGTPAPLSASAERGLAFAKANCAGCHAVEGSGASPNAEAPAFAAIANMPDLTGETLRQYLRDSHNYPAAMNFTVEPAQIDDLADYVVTLKRADYKPDI
ncbi:MAG: cytochrome c [Sphingomonadaceae bacterium]|nr:cytochrome c [Sphingomonadaceae bacterium]